MIPTAEDIKTVTDLRENTISVLDGIKKKERPTLIMHNNTPKGVLLSVDEYNHLIEMLEDYEDELEARDLEEEAKKATKKDLISLEKLAEKHEVAIR